MRAWRAWVAAAVIVAACSTSDSTGPGTTYMAASWDGGTVPVHFYPGTVSDTTSWLTGGRLDMTSADTLRLTAALVIASDPALPLSHDSVVSRVPYQWSGDSIVTPVTGAGGKRAGSTITFTMRYPAPPSTGYVWVDHTFVFPM